MKISLKKSPFLLLLFGLTLAGMLQLSVETAAAQQPTPSDDEVNAVAREMYCPVCENIPLDVCPTTACQQWRDLIRLKISEGLTTEEIKAYFALQYGDRVLAQPPARGLNWIIYVLPPLFILCGMVLLYRYLNQSTRKAVVQEKSQVPANDQEKDIYAERLEQELKRRDEGR